MNKAEPHLSDHLESLTPCPRELCELEAGRPHPSQWHSLPLPEPNMGGVSARAQWRMPMPIGHGSDGSAEVLFSSLNVFSAA